MDNDLHRYTAQEVIKELGRKGYIYFSDRANRSEKLSWFEF